MVQNATAVLLHQSFTQATLEASKRGINGLQIVSSFEELRDAAEGSLATAEELHLIKEQLVLARTDGFGCDTAPERAMRLMGARCHGLVMVPGGRWDAEHGHTYFQHPEKHEEDIKALIDPDPDPGPTAANPPTAPAVGGRTAEAEQRRQKARIRVAPTPLTPRGCVHLGEPGKEQPQWLPPLGCPAAVTLAQTTVRPRKTTKKKIEKNSGSSEPALPGDHLIQEVQQLKAEQKKQLALSKMLDTKMDEALILIRKLKGDPR